MRITIKIKGMLYVGTLRFPTPLSRGDANPTPLSRGDANPTPLSRRDYMNTSTLQWRGVWGRSAPPLSEHTDSQRAPHPVEQQDESQ